jgi:MFS family permease
MSSKPDMSAARELADPLPGARGGRLLALAAVIGVAAIFGLTYSLCAPLIALSLSGRGASETLIGLNAAMHAAGVLLMAPMLPFIAARHGARRVMLVALLASAVLLGLFATTNSLAAWFALRLLLGMASEALFVLSEAWTNALVTDADRGKAMAAYTACLSLGFALGPLVLSFTGEGGALPWGIGALCCLAALVVVAQKSIPAPDIEAPHGRDPRRYLRAAPLAFGATALNAAVEAAGLSFLPLYAIHFGWSEEAATQLVTTLLIGAILLQLPIGWLSDRVDRRRLVTVLAVVATLGALAWPFLMPLGWICTVALFVWGGVFVGIYTVMITMVGNRFKGGELVGIYAGMGLLWGVGALIGPLLSGAANGLTAHGLPLSVALLCGGFAILAASGIGER